MAGQPIGTVLGGTLSPNATIIPKVGYVVVDIGGNVWKSLADAANAIGCRLGICVNPPAVPGTPMQVQVNGALPYWLWNLGAGNPSPVIAGTTPGRGYQGQVIGLCDTSGAICLVDSYIGIPGQIGDFFLAVLGGVAFNTIPPLVGQAPVFDGTRFTFQPVANNQLFPIVRVNTLGTGGAKPSPYNANPYDFVVIDTSGGNVQVNLPALTLGQAVATHHDENTSLAGHMVTITGPVNIAQPPPNNGPPTSTSYSYTGAQYAGTDLTWFNSGSAGGYSVR